jgi:hypothetical protein
MKSGKRLTTSKTGKSSKFDVELLIFVSPKYLAVLPSTSRNSKKNLDFYCFATSLWLEEPDTDPSVSGTDPWFRIRICMGTLNVTNPERSIFKQYGMKTCSH